MLYYRIISKHAAGVLAQQRHYLVFVLCQVNILPLNINAALVVINNKLARFEYAVWALCLLAFPQLNMPNAVRMRASSSLAPKGLVI